MTPHRLNAFSAAAVVRAARFAVCLGLAAATFAPTTGAEAKTPVVDDQRVVEAIDTALAAAWRDARVSPSKPAPDGAWARRAYLDLVGRTPMLEELDAFVAEPRRERRRWLVDRLLGAEYVDERSRWLATEYGDERSRWLATEWSNLLVGRTGGRNGGSLVHRDGFDSYLRATFARGAGYDRFMRELVTATGSVLPTDEDDNGAANFLADKLAEDGVQATAKTAQVFLGVSVQCTRCHNHPFNEHRQNQFWELNAFFRQTRVERTRDGENPRRYARLVDRDYFGEGRGRNSLASLAPGQADQAESYYELRNGRLKVAYPVFLDGTALADVFASRGTPHGDSGRVELVNRREELASLIVESPEFARAAVNREWGRLLGHGFTRPVDDMGPHNPPVMPELLDTLADAFRDAGFDLDRLTRWIVLSRPYQLDSRAGRSNADDDPTLGTPPLFSRFYLRQLSAEQIYESLLTATRADRGLDPDRARRARERWLRQFTTAFGNDENGESTSFNGSIPQALAMMNGDLTRRATELAWPRAGPSAAGMASAGGVGFLTQVAADPELDNRDRIERLYLATLARRPSKPELTVSNRLLAAREGDVGEALRDVWWALLNSNEFILQH